MQNTVSLPPQTLENKHKLFKAYTQYLVPILKLPYKGRIIDVLSTIMYWIYLNKDKYKVNGKINFEKLNIDLGSSKVKSEIQDLIPFLYDNPKHHASSVETDMYRNLLTQLRKVGCFRETIITKNEDDVRICKNNKTILLASNLLFNFIYSEFNTLEFKVTFKVDE